MKRERRRLRVLFSGRTRSLAHAARLVRLARCARAAGHDVALAGERDWLGHPAVLRRGELPVAKLSEPPLDDLLRAARGLAPVGSEVDRFTIALADDLKLQSRLRPDLVVVDNRRSALIAAEQQGTPTISLTTTSLLGPHCGLAPSLSQYDRIYGPTIGMPPGALRSSATFAGLPDDEPVPFRHMPLGRRLAQLASSGGRLRQFAHELSLGQHTLVLDPPSLFPARDLPASAVQVGPLLPQLACPALPLPPRSDRPRVYLTFGATGRPEVFADVVRGLLASGLELVISTGGLIDLPSHPRIWGGDLLDADAVFPQVDAVVCHGGTLTVLHALHHGCPVVTVPGHAEQAVTAMAVERAGVGRVVSAPEVIHSPHRLIEATRSLCADPTWAQKAARLQVDGDQAERSFLRLLTDYALPASAGADLPTKVS